MRGPGLRIQHASEIRHQIAAREERALQERRDFLEEGNVIRAQVRRRGGFS